jgi:hypothetical protein
MPLTDYYFHDPRLILIPIEQLTPEGMRPEFAALLVLRGWEHTRVDLFNRAFTLYWTRTADLASRSRTWAPPRIRHVGVVTEPFAVRPYAQLLNTSTWLLYESDFDPVSSHPEFAAYLLAHGDRMTLTGEVTMAALHNAAYWFERTEAECAAFASAAARSTRPDAAAFRHLAAAIPWLRQLHHTDLRPPPSLGSSRTIPGSGLSVPRVIEASPPALVQQWTEVAQSAVSAFYAAWRAADRNAVATLCDWLAAEAPPLLITRQGGGILWDPDVPGRVGALRAELRCASGAGVCEITADLSVIERHSRDFLAALVDPLALPAPSADTEQGGYCYMHRSRRLLAYNLHERDIERLQSPALPYARAMLGARAVHEWAHLAVQAGWVPSRVTTDRLGALAHDLAEQLERVIADAPSATRQQTARDLTALQTAATTPGTALVHILMARMPDYQANLLLQRFSKEIERETYVRQNIRTLRPEYTPDQLWRMLARYLMEFQYLRFSAVTDPRTFFLTSTWFDSDFLASGIFDDSQFDGLTAAVARICATYAVDESRFRRTPGPDSGFASGAKQDPETPVD